MTQAALECREAEHVYQAKQSHENVNSSAQEVSDDNHSSCSQHSHAVPESRLDLQAVRTRATGLRR
jgi:hypothetical protein